MDHGHSHHGDIAKKFTGVERRRRAVELRLRGWTWQQVADGAGYASAGAAHNAVTKELLEAKNKLAMDSETLRQQEIEHLYMLRRAANVVLESRHIVVQQGGTVVARKPGTGTWDPQAGMWVDAEFEEIINDAPVLNAVDTLLRVAQRLAKLAGLDAPTQTEVRQYDYRINGVDAGEVA